MLLSALTTLVDNTPLAAISFDQDFVITTWSGQAEKVFGWTAEEAIGRRADNFPPIHEDDKAAVESVFAQLAQAQTRFVVSHNRNYTRSGKVVSCEWYNSAVHDEQGRLSAVLSMVLDVTERNRVEEDLRHQRDLTASITDNATTAIFVTDRAGRCTFMNPAAEAMTGYSFAEIHGRSLHEILNYQHPDGEPYPASGCRCLDAVNKFGTVSRQETFARRNGEIFPARFNAKQIRTNGVFTGSVIEVRDITEQVRAESDLRDASRRKNEFLATLAHELRNPLAPLKSGLDLLKLAKGSPEVVEQTRSTMERQVAHLVRLVDDLLDVSRITLDKIALKKARVELAAVLRQAVEVSRPHINEPGHELRVSIPPEPIYLDADPVRLTQVFSNLLNNSCKYTGPVGRISLGAALEGDRVAVTVSDTGTGIPPQMLTRVFDLFTQVDRPLERLAGGLGIGLSLARRLVEMHGGSIEARSAGEGTGSEFVVRLPVVAERPMAGTLKAEPAAPGKPRRVLVVDDNVDAAAMLAQLLELNGHQSAVAHDGPEALEALESLRPEIVLLDIGLPRMNGREVCRLARKKPWGRKIVFVALTGLGQEDDRAESENAGFDAHLTKPVGYETLIELVESLARQADRSAA